MTIIDPVKTVFSPDFRGSFGYSSGFGSIRFGKSLYGFLSDVCGIFQRKKTSLGWRTSRMAFYAPANPQTVVQQAWRSVFADGWVAYASLTSEQKQLLSKQAQKYRLSGPQLFMKRWLQSHR